NMTFLTTALGLTLCFVWASADILPQPDFNIEGMSGKWYLTGFATNAQWFIIHKQTMGTGTSTFTPMDGNLDMPFESLNPDGTCFRLHNLAKKTDVPGKFTYVGQGSVNDMRIVDVKYDEYALIYTVKTIGDTSDAVIKAYSRSPELSSEIQEKFRQFALENGVLPENMVILPKNGNCPEDCPTEED
uniref:Lipocalin/cytosolic fatty-acid binding domain-containing protein n=1 Tax=Periophthalmus magnuspinnatus TaxID=409849 RepID=A0A3B3ZV45_9GOBI